MQIYEKAQHVDIPIELYKKIKIHCFNEGITVKQFFLDLAKEQFK